MKLPDFPEVGALSAQEKLQLVDELWLSVAPQPGSMGVSQEEKDLLDSRGAAFLKDPASALSEEQFREKLRKHRRCTI
jgi:putative addiction module component (TIGR02574 family)